MKEKIYNLLNLLIKVSNDNIDDNLVQTRNTLENDIKETRKKIIEHEKLMDSNRYFDESQQLLDKNTINELEKKSNYLKNEISSIKSKLKTAVETEKFLNEKISLGKENVEKYAELLKNITYKLVDKDVNLEYYDQLMNKNESKLDYWNKFVKTNEKDWTEKSNIVTELKANKESYEYDLSKIREKIEETNHNLENELNYFNRELKEQDEKEHSKLNEIINNLEQSYDELINSVGFKALEFIELVDEENYIYAGSKLKEIIWKLEYIPYALDNNYENLENNLKNLKKEKNNIQIKIKNNDYLNENSKIQKNRLHDLNILLEQNRLHIIEVKKMINKIDKEKSFELSSKINDLDVDEEMLANYNFDLNHLIEYSIILKNTSLKYLEKYRKSLNEQIDEISKKLALKEGLIDEKRKLIDIDVIKDITRNIELIEKRLDNKINIYDIKDNIELLLNSIDFDFEKELEKQEEVEEKSDLKFLKVINIVSPKNDIIDLTGV